MAFCPAFSPPTFSISATEIIVDAPRCRRANRRVHKDHPNNLKVKSDFFQHRKRPDRGENTDRKVDPPVPSPSVIFIIKESKDQPNENTDKQPVILIR